jgi:hypothetical protein
VTAAVRIRPAVLLAVLILGVVADLALAALLVGISGFVFGGPEGLRGEISAVMGWSAALAAAVAAPALGGIFYARGRKGAGTLIAWLPALGAIFVAMGGIG